MYSGVCTYRGNQAAPLLHNTDPGSDANASTQLCVCMDVNDLRIIWASRSTVHAWRCVHTVVVVVTVRLYKPWAGTAVVATQGLCHTGGTIHPTVAEAFCYTLSATTRREVSMCLWQTQHRSVSLGRPLPWPALQRAW